ncbi:MAG: hypothetical protein ACR2HC_04615 [Thermoleophilaceae bacterium]
MGAQQRHDVGVASVGRGGQARALGGKELVERLVDRDGDREIVALPGTTGQPEALLVQPTSSLDGGVAADLGA